MMAQKAVPSMQHVVKKRQQACRLSHHFHLVTTLSCCYSFVMSAWSLSLQTRCMPRLGVSCSAWNAPALGQLQQMSSFTFLAHHHIKPKRTYIPDTLRSKVRKVTMVLPQSAVCVSLQRCTSWCRHCHAWDPAFPEMQQPTCIIGFEVDHDWNIPGACAQTYDAMSPVVLLSWYLMLLREAGFALL